MKLIKYDRAKDGDANGTTIINSTTSSSSGGGDDNSSRSGGERTVWGQSDNGMEDIDGSMIINGNVTIKAIVPPTYDDDDDADGDDVDEETGGGNLDVEEKIHAGKEVSSESVKATKEVTSPEVYGKKVFLDYNNTKTNVSDLINDHESRITQNEADIAALDGRVSTVESNITTINNNITTIDGDIDDIKDRLDSLEDGEGALTETQINDMIHNAVHYPTATPVVLLTGEIYSYNNGSDKTWQYWYGMNIFKHGFIQDYHISYVSKDDNIPALKITFDFNPNYDVHLSAVSAMVLEATDWNAYDHNAGYNARSKGYWCTGGVKDQAVYLEAWRTQDDNNDSVRFDCIAYKVKRMSLTITGYAYLKTS